jgi:HEAT repeat protein
LIAALKDDSSEVRRAAALALSWLPTSGKQAISALTAAVKDKDAGMRWQAVYTLGKLTPESEPGIIEALKSDDPKVQELALHTFWQCGFKNKTALPWLIKALKKEGYQNIRHNAIYCLGNLGADAREAIPVLEAITEPDMQIHIEFGLKRIRGPEQK